MTDDRLDLRISSDLKARLKAAAAADGRSLSNFCIRVLEQALSDSPTGGDARYTKRERDILLDALRIAEPIEGDPAWEALADRIEDQPHTPPRPKGKR